VWFGVNIAQHGFFPNLFKFDASSKMKKLIVRAFILKLALQNIGLE
jgi:hypothetical protein